MLIAVSAIAKKAGFRSLNGVFGKVEGEQPLPGPNSSAPVATILGEE